MTTVVNIFPTRNQKQFNAHHPLGAPSLRDHQPYPLTMCGAPMAQTPRLPRQPVFLHVCLVTETFLPEVNGVAMTLGRLVAGMRSAGHRMTVVRPRQDSDPSQENDQTLRLGFPIPGYPLLRFGLPCGARLRSLWRKQRPDVVHIATEGPMGQSAMAAAHDLGIPVITTFHTNFHQYSSHYSMGFMQQGVAAYLRHFHNRACCTLVPTHHVRSELGVMGLKRLRILSRGVDTELYNPGCHLPGLREHWGVEDNGLAVLCVGRLAAEKNLALAVEAFQAMQAIRPGSRLILVGNGPERSRLEGIPGVILTGQLPDRELAQHYASADLFLFPSITETFGNVLTEAMASGLPVVAFNYAAAAERLQDGVQGLRVPFADRAAFIEAAERMAHTSPDELRAMAEAAIATARDWTWQRIIGQYLQSLRHALSMVPTAQRSSA